MDVKIKVYTLIVTYNGTKWLHRCFESLRKSTITLNTVVVDNGSSDGTVTILRQEYPEVIIIESKTNLGFGRGNNLGIEYCLKQSADYIFLLNQDAWIFPDTMKKLLAANTSGIISPIHLDGTGTQFEPGFLNCLNPIYKNKEIITDYLLGIEKRFFTVPFINAAAWLIPINTIKIIGGFDPIFFHYGEDVNYAQRLKYHKLVFSLVPHAFICHDAKSNIKSSIFLKTETRHNFLLLYANVNIREFPLRFIGSHFRLVRNFIIAIFSLNFNSLWNIISHCWFILTHLGTISKSRKQNKIIGPNWIRLD